MLWYTGLSHCFVHQHPILEYWLRYMQLHFRIKFPANASWEAAGEVPRHPMGAPDGVLAPGFDLAVLVVDN